MNKILINISIFGLLIASSVSAQGMMGNYNNPGSPQLSSTTIDAALQNITQSQNISTLDKINCSKVTDDQFEKLGDAVMGSGISEQQHTTMENMMGGEGSSSLKQAHITMGRSYIGCWSGYNGNPSWVPMMGYITTNSYSQPWGMMGSWGNGDGMMGIYGHSGWTHWITMILVWVLLALGVAVLVKWLTNKK